MARKRCVLVFFFILKQEMGPSAWTKFLTATLTVPMFVHSRSIAHGQQAIANHFANCVSILTKKE